MAYNLMFCVTKDLIPDTEFLSSFEEQEFILRGGQVLENLNLSTDEILNICASQNKTVLDYLSEIEPNLSDPFSYPKINGNVADVYLVDSESKKQIRVVSFEIIDEEKTQKLHEKLENNGKNLENMTIIPIINEKGKKSNLYLSEEEKKYLIILDCHKYCNDYAGESQKRDQNGQRFEIIQKSPKRKTNLTVDEAYKMLDL